MKSFKKFLNEGIQDDERLSQRNAALLNSQIRNEMESCLLYRSMASWLDDNGWVNGYSLFSKYSNEEYAHANKIYDYLAQRNTKSIPSDLSISEVSWPDIRTLLEASLEHEMLVTSQWNEIAKNAKISEDHDLYSFALGFAKEQVEEEEKFRNLLFKLDRGMPEWKLEEEFKGM